MKLKALILQNFRAYQEARLDIGDMTALIGKNDAGKSSILEALEIFFNNSLVKLDSHDPHKGSGSEEVTIGCIFTDFPEELILDRHATTNLADEYLLNQKGDLEIHKVFRCGNKISGPSVYVSARHPTVGRREDLLLLKNSDLKACFDELGLAAEGVDRRSNPALRRAIWQNAGDLQLATKLISVNEADAKAIWEALQKYLPLYALFKADRPSRDEDAEVQDPMKVAIAEALKELQEELGEIKEIVERKVAEVARRTVAKIKEMEPNLAQQNFIAMLS